MRTFFASPRGLNRVTFVGAGTRGPHLTWPDQACGRLTLSLTRKTQRANQPSPLTKSPAFAGLFSIAGAGLIPKPATGPAAQGTLAEKRIVAAIAHRIEEWWPLGREVGWLRELGGGGA